MSHRFTAPVLWILFTTPGSAFAHSSVQGFNHFLHGFIHPIFVATHLLLLIALGLFYGQQGVKACLIAIKAFLLSAAIGLAASWFVIEGNIDLLILGEAVIIGLLVATRPSIHWVWCSGIGIVAGILLGLDSNQETLSAMDRVVVLFGTLVGVSLLLLYSVVFANYFNSKHWQRIGIRIIGSWISAIALLMLALSISTKR
jgi:urease accessory protein